MIEERNLEICPVMLARLLSEICRSEPVSVGARPAAVIPWPDNQNIEDTRILFFYGFVSTQGPVQVLIVIPPAYGHRRTLYIFQFRQDIARFPIVVVSWMGHHLVPKFDTRSKGALILVRNFFQAPEIKKEIIAVLGRPAFPRFYIAVSCRRSRAFLAEAGEEREILCEEQRPVVVHVVPVKPIANRSLRRAGFQRGV